MRLLILDLSRTLPGLIIQVGAVTSRQTKFMLGTSKSKLLSLAGPRSLCRSVRLLTVVFGTTANRQR